MRTLIKHVPYHAIAFGARDNINNYLNRDQVNKKSLVSLGNNFLSGSLAGLATIMVTHPLEVIGTKWGVELMRDKSTRRFNNMGACTRFMYNLGGLRAIFQGFNLAAISTILNRGMYFGLYDSIKALTERNGRDLPLHLKYISALLATTAGIAISNPIENIMKEYSISKFSLRPKEIYVNYGDCVTKMWKAEGWSAFFKFNIVSVYKICLGAPFILMFYDELKNKL